MFGRNDGQDIALRQEFLLEIVCNLDSQADAEFLIIVDQSLLR